MIRKILRKFGHSPEKPLGTGYARKREEPEFAAAAFPRGIWRNMKKLIFALTIVAVAGISSAHASEESGDDQIAQSTELTASATAPDDDERIPGESQNNDLNLKPGKPCEGACN